MQAGMSQRYLLGVSFSLEAMRLMPCTCLKVTKNVCYQMYVMCLKHLRPHGAKVAFLMRRLILSWIFIPHLDFVYRNDPQFLDR